MVYATKLKYRSTHNRGTYVLVWKSFKMYSRFSRNEVMGSAKVPLSRVEVAGGAEVWAELSRERRPPEELQELLLSLSYLPSAERLTVVVLKARNLLPPQEGKDALGT